MRPTIPVIDLFAGPGGLGEGFSAFKSGRQPTFKIRLSIEKDVHAHRTLELRSFFRQFPDGRAPRDYYRYLRQQISREELFRRWPRQARAAAREALLAELGGKDQEQNEEIEKHIAQALGPNSVKPWVLIGGPPCQAYSLIGRNRRRASDPEQREEFEADERHFLYRAYLHIIAQFRPPVFVMENVKGILSSKIKDEMIFGQILRDLRRPLDALRTDTREEAAGAALQPTDPPQTPLEYRIYSLVISKPKPEKLEPLDFVIQAEEFGIPQTRHRVILLGVRSDIGSVPRTLRRCRERVTVRDVLADLPPLRSVLSRGEDTPAAWRSNLCSILDAAWYTAMEPGRVSQRIGGVLRRVRQGLGTGGGFVPCPGRPRVLQQHYHDPRLGGACNHEARAHMRSDLHRYMFASCFARVHRRSPLIRDFPAGLRPDHGNVHAAVNDDVFDDRFRVQLADRPGATVTSHFAKDGHYAIHYDPWQCRSLTVREAARLQTFPDNYFFEASRTQQYRQVGNAVPPLLAQQIAEVVFGVLKTVNRTNRTPRRWNARAHGRRTRAGRGPRRPPRSEPLC